MALEVQEMWNICRFCLSQEEDILAPVTTILDSYLTIEDVERFTGVSIELIDNVQQAVCVYCTYRLQESVAFRSACISNDTYYRKLSGLNLNASTSVFSKLNASDALDPLEVEVERKQASAESLSNPKEKEKMVKIELQEPVIDEPLVAAAQDSDNQPVLNTRNELQVADEFYSANYIEPGVSAYSETDECESDEDNKSSSHTLNNKAHQNQSRQKIRFTTKEGYTLFDLSLNECKTNLCDICGKMVKNLVSHIYTHTKETNFACPHCPTRMTHAANLMRHINAVHLKVVAKSCELCGKGFTHNTCYVSHMRSHHEIGKLHECKICSKKFRHPSCLRSHFQRAHGTQSYKCTTCGMCFKARDALQRHQLVHSSDKRYACSECPKRFKTSMTRRIHELTHRGALFKCTICDKSYSYKSLLKMHLRKMHPSDNEDANKDML